MEPRHREEGGKSQVWIDVHRCIYAGTSGHRKTWSYWFKCESCAAIVGVRTGVGALQSSSPASDAGDFCTRSQTNSHKADPTPATPHPRPPTLLMLVHWTPKGSEMGTLEADQWVATPFGARETRRMRAPASVIAVVLLLRSQGQLTSSS